MKIEFQGVIFMVSPFTLRLTVDAKMRKCCNMKRVMGDLSWLIKVRIRKIEYILVIKCSLQLFFL